MVPLLSLSLAVGCGSDPAAPPADAASVDAADVAAPPDAAPGDVAADSANDAAPLDASPSDATVDAPIDAPAPPDASPDAPPPMDAPAEDPVERAFRTGVVGDATAPALCAATRAAIAAVGPRRLAVWSAIYGTSATGAATPSTVTDFTWPITHDSMVLDSLDEERNVPLVAANAWTRGADAPRSLLGVAAEAGAWRYAAFGTNGLSDFGRTPPAAGSPEARMESLFVRTVRWLTRNEAADGAGLNVVVAHLADSFYFRHDAGTRAFFTRNLPAARLNADDTCESASLPGCLATANLLVLGGDDGTGDDNSHVPLDLAAIASALDAAQARGIPVLYVPHYRDENAMTALVHPRMRVAVRNNYFNVETVTRGTPGDVTARPSALDRMRAAVDTVCDGTLAPADYAACEPGAASAATTLRSCAAPDFRTKLMDGAEAFRTALGALDASARSPFALDGYRLLRGAVLLGDAFRAGASGATPVRYPVDRRADAPAFARSVFADHVVHVAHATNRAQADLGTYACPRASVLTARCAPYDPAAVATAAATVTASFLPGDEWTSTGRYALAGRPFRVRRTDTTDARLSVRVGFAREGTTRAFGTSGTSSQYDRPQYLVSPWVRLAAGAEVELSSPLGGPIYLRLEGSAAVAGMPAAVDFTGTAQHAALLEATPAAANAFVREVMASPLPHVDLRLTGFEVHLRKDKFLSTVMGSTDIADRPSGAYTVRYNGDLARALDHFQNHYVGPVYALAGFAAPGSTLAASLSADEQAICTALGWACTDAAIHRRSTIQHANYDEYANCGSGCSGNPFDASWSIIPLGWGESHELGHNLQTNALNVHWMAPADRNDWSRWQNRAGENSNNIFPYHTLWRFVRTVDRDATEVRDGHMNFKSLFAASQSARANLVSNVGGAMRRVIFDERCNVLADGAPTDTDLLPDAIWGDPAYAADNGLRMAFYVGLPIRLQGRTIRGRRLTDGWDIVPLLYAHARLLGDAARDATRWNAARASLGFERFAYNGDATYGGRTVASIPGNDFLVVALSFLVGTDFRPYFRDHGVRFSDLADAQVQAHVTAGRATGSLGGSAVVLDTDLAPADLSAVPTVALNGTATWPRDGFHPSRCVR
ncbi:MAG: ImpA family metalloprotease [Polyangiales bacterium]